MGTGARAAQVGRMVAVAVTDGEVSLNGFRWDGTGEADKTGVRDSLDIPAAS